MEAQANNAAAGTKNRFAGMNALKKQIEVLKELRDAAGKLLIVAETNAKADIDSHEQIDTKAREVIGIFAKAIEAAEEAANRDFADEIPF